MITTLEQIIRDNGFELLKKYDIRMWIGSDKELVYCISSIVFLNEKEAFIWYKDYYQFDKIKCCKELSSTMISKCETIIWAKYNDDLYEDIEKLKKDEKETMSRYATKILDLFSEISRLMCKCSYKTVTKIIDQFSKSDSCAYLRNRIYLFLDKDENLINEDVKMIISDIWKSGKVTFDNSNESNIYTVLDLHQATSIKHCIYKEKESVCFTFSNKESYYITEKDNEEIFLALMVLYGF